MGRVRSRSTYYCEIDGDYTYEFSKGVYRIPYRKQYHTKLTRCISYSIRVWTQGPRGGVRIIKDEIGSNFGYVTKDEKLMKEFMWVKLKAREYAGYA